MKSLKISNPIKSIITKGMKTPTGFAQNFLNLALAVGLASCSGVNSGNPGTIIQALTAGDLSTAFYDVTSDVINKSEAQAALRKTALASPLEVKDVEGDFGGTASLNGNLGEQIKAGLISFLDFREREGLPAFAKGKIEFNLEHTPTTIKGTIGSESISIEGVEISFLVTYDLLLQNSLWRGKMIGFLMAEGVRYEINYDYDTPILRQMEVVALDASGAEVPGPLTAGNSARMKLTIYSNAPLNFISTIWNSPVGNIIGGGQGANYCSHPCGSNASRTFNEKSRGHWTYEEAFEVSTFRPSGTYSWEASVQSTAQLESRSRSATLEVVGGNDQMQKPTVVDVAVKTSGNGNGQPVLATLKVLSQSAAPVTFLSSVLDGPTRNVYGGGMGTTFTECSTMNGLADDHLCKNRGAGYWYAESQETLGAWAENGIYSYKMISVHDASGLESDDFGLSRTFAISGNPIAQTPVISSVTLSVRNATGQLLANNGGCVETANASNELRVQITIRSTSNAPITFRSSSFSGPNGNLMGGGSGVSPSDEGGGVYTVTEDVTVATPNFAPKGTYYWNMVSVENEGQKQSAVWAGALNFKLLDDCP
jgi:hypothetical protein